MCGFSAGRGCGSLSAGLQPEKGAVTAGQPVKAADIAHQTGAESEIQDRFFGDPCKNAIRKPDWKV